MNSSSMPPIPLPTDEFVPVGTASPLQTQQAKPKWFWRTVGEALALVFINIVLSVFLKALHGEFFLASDANTDELQKMVSRPLVLFLSVVVLAPLLEELIFRGIPSLLLRGVWKLRHWKPDARDNFYWVFGSIAAFLFSIMHGIGDKSLHLPVPQLLMGFFLWNAAMKRGLRYSMLMHATYNLIPALLILSSAGVKR